MSETKDIILKASNISKQYRLGLVGTGTISHDLNRWWHRVRGKDDPYLKIGDSNDRSTKAESDYVWALQDINFKVKRGEVLGIIGKNGAGKSTLLKILSKVTTPTTGEIKTKGRIASLLEVGTGFHPEMTGRENIYLNGAILGMTKAEINAKLDEIIDFSGCARYIDTPVKRYSSGMKVRLAFAVAAHLEPEILVVDEVLAVGDAEFQKKAIGKMQDISKGGGRTVLFVSHNMAAVKSLCTRGIVLEHGKLVFDGTSDEAVDYYLQSGETIQNTIYVNKEPAKVSDILKVSVSNDKGELTSSYGFQDQIILNIQFTADKKAKDKAIMAFRVIDQKERAVFSSTKSIKEIIESNVNEKKISIELPTGILAPNDYRINIGYHIPNQEIIKVIKDAVSFTIEETGSGLEKFKGNDYGCVVLPCEWR